MNGFADGSEENVTSRAQAAGSPSPAEVKQALGIVAALNLVRMSLGMYPPGHAKISESFDSAFAILQAGLKKRSEWPFKITGETLLLGETALDPKNTAVRDYSRTLNNFRILSFSLHRGLKKKDLIEFSRILSSKPSDIWVQGKIEVILAGAGVAGIQVKQADADLYNLNGERTIAQDQARRKRAGEAFWREFISRLDESGHPDRGEAVRLLNEQRQHWQMAGLNYEGMIRDYFQEIREGRKVSAELQENLARVGSIIQELHPDLKRQFLEVVERQISLQPEQALIVDHLKCFPREIFLEIVNQANRKKSQISPALVMILQKMSGLEEDKATGNEAGREEFSREEMAKLFKREEHEKYVPEEYDRILKKAAQTTRTGPDAEEERFPLREHLKTIAEDQTGLRIGQMLLALMDEETPEEVYAACAAGLARIVPELVQAGQFHFLTGVIETLRRHAREEEKPSEKIRREALSVLKPFSDPKPMAKSVAPLILRGSTDPGGVTKFLTACGSQHVPWLFDLYLDSPSPAPAALVDLLRGFGRSAVDEAVKRLIGQSPQKIVQIVIFLRAAGDPSAAACLKGLSDHEDWNVKREVIETLLHYGDPAAAGILRKSLGSKNREELFNAVSLACRYRVTGLTGDLMAHLKTLVIRDEDTILNDWIVKQIGATGDPAFVPCLEKISRIRFSLTPGQLFRMKSILYGSLIHFPRESVQRMLERGRRSWHRNIRAVCTKILAQ